MSTAAASKLELNQRFHSDLVNTLAPAAEGMSELLNLKFEMFPEKGETLPLSEILSEYGGDSGGSICCRSVFLRRDNGIGGILIPQRPAVVAACAALMLDAAEHLEEFSFEGIVREALDEIWNIFLGTWNSVAPPDYRMSGKTNERAVEYYPDGMELPEAAGVYPYAFEMPMAIGDIKDSITVFLPPRVVHGKDLLPFTPLEHFQPNTVTAGSGTDAATAPEAAPDSGGAVSGAPAAPMSTSAAVASITPTGNPVVFFDYTGQLLKWLHRQGASSRTRCLYAEELDVESLVATGEHAAATVIVGMDPEKLKELGKVAAVEIRPR